jgi:hypothetical protein
MAFGSGLTWRATPNKSQQQTGRPFWFFEALRLSWPPGC